MSTGDEADTKPSPVNLGDAADDVVADETFNELIDEVDQGSMQEILPEELDPEEFTESPVVVDMTISFEILPGQSGPDKIQRLILLLASGPPLMEVLPTGKTNNKKSLATVADLESLMRSYIKTDDVREGMTVAEAKTKVLLDYAVVHPAKDCLTFLVRMPDKIQLRPILRYEEIATLVKSKVMTVTQAEVDRAFYSGHSGFVFGIPAINQNVNELTKLDTLNMIKLIRAMDGVSGYTLLQGRPLPPFRMVPFVRLMDAPVAGDRPDRTFFYSVICIKRDVIFVGELISEALKNSTVEYPFCSSVKPLFVSKQIFYGKLDIQAQLDLLEQQRLLSANYSRLRVGGLKDIHLLLDPNDLHSMTVHDLLMSIKAVRINKYLDVERGEYLFVRVDQVDDEAIVAVFLTARVLEVEAFLRTVEVFVAKALQVHDDFFEEYFVNATKVLRQRHHVSLDNLGRSQWQQSLPQLQVPLPSRVLGSKAGSRRQAQSIAAEAELAALFGPMSIAKTPPPVQASASVARAPASGARVSTSSSRTIVPYQGSPDSRSKDSSHKRGSSQLSQAMAPSTPALRRMDDGCPSWALPTTASIASSPGLDDQQTSTTQTASPLTLAEAESARKAQQAAEAEIDQLRRQLAKLKAASTPQQQGPRKATPAPPSTHSKKKPVKGFKPPASPLGNQRAASQPAVMDRHDSTAAAPIPTAVVVANSRSRQQVGRRFARQSAAGVSPVTGHPSEESVARNTGGTDGPTDDEGFIPVSYKRQRKTIAEETATNEAMELEQLEELFPTSKSTVATGSSMQVEDSPPVADAAAGPSP